MVKTVKTVCSYCGVGCGILLETRDDKIVGLTGDPEHPANRGALCSKGRNLHLTVNHAERAVHPLMRNNFDLPYLPVSWETALETSARKFADIIRRDGPDAVAFYVSGQLMTEDYYVLNKLMKGFIGSNNIDSNSRLCMSSAVAGYKRAFGVDGPPACYDDIDHADTIFLFGANPAFAHPILYRRMEAAKAKNPKQRMVVVDPRRTDSCSLADLHLPIRPGTDVALLLAMFNVLLWEGLIDDAYVAAHTNGLEAAAAEARAMTPRKAAEICGVPASDIVTAAYWFGEGKSLSMWTMGFNQSTRGVDKNNALINLHLATGQIGKPGCGPLSLTGQPNAMGGREAGGLANILPGHRDLANEIDRNELAKLWNITSIDAKPGLTAVPLFEALESGKVKAVWIVCTNPVVSLPNTAQVRRALSNAEWVMVSDAYHPTDTTQFAHAVFPAAGWGEKEGSMTNAERRVAHLQQAIAAPGEALPDWRIATLFARALGKELGHDWSAAFPFEKAGTVYDEHVMTTVGRDCDVGGLNYETLDHIGPQQWPFRAGAAQGAARLYADGKFETPDQRGRFVPVVYKPVAQSVNEKYPLSLTTGRIRDQWHTMTKTGRVPALNQQAPAPTLQMHPNDAQARGLANGDLADVISELGRLVFPIEISEDIREQVVFAPMHWGEMTARGGEINKLFPGLTDPISQQPEFKHCPVEVRKSTLAWRGAVLIGGDHVPVGRELIRAFPYGSVVCYGAGHPMTVIEFGAEKTLTASHVEHVDQVLGDVLRDEIDTLEYNDRKRGVFKRIWLDQNHLKGVRWVGYDTERLNWLKSLLLSGAEIGDLRPWLLAPQSNTLPALKEDKGPIVCACMNVGAREVERCIQEGAASVEAIGKACKAGTSCGSCVPQLKRTLTASRRANTSNPT